MCVVSLVTQSIPQQWPNWTVTTSTDPEDLRMLREILEKLDKLDKKLGAKDCPKDATKLKFIEELEARIEALEDELWGDKE